MRQVSKQSIPGFKKITIFMKNCSQLLLRLYTLLMIHLGPNSEEPKCDPEKVDPEDWCNIFNKVDVPIRFPPDKRLKRAGCKVKPLNYWVMRRESQDSAGNKIVNLYANHDKSFTLTQLHDGFGPDYRRYTKEIAWVQCTPGFINEVRYRSKSPEEIKPWYNGCGVTIELVKICIQDIKLNKATKQLMQRQLRDDRKWETTDQINTIETLNEEKYGKLEKLMFNLPNAENPNQLREEFCSNLIGIIPYKRLLEPSEDGGLKKVLKAASEAGPVNKLFFKYFDKSATKFISYDLKDALTKYKDGRIGKKKIVADEYDEDNGVTGKIFFCKAGSDFDIATE